MIPAASSSATSWSAGQLRGGLEDLDLIGVLQVEDRQGHRLEPEDLLGGDRVQPQL